MLRKNIGKVLMGYLVLGFSACEQPFSEVVTPLSVSQVASPDLALSTDLEQEYSAFTTQALTQGYLTRKLNHWLRFQHDRALLREVAFGCHKHPQSLKLIFAADALLYDRVMAVPELTAGMAQKPDLAVCLEQTVKPVSPTPVDLRPPNYTIPELNMVFSGMPAGSFQMGQEDLSMATPVHTVQLSEFHMQTTEVTQGQWATVMGAENWPENGPTEGLGVGASYPAYNLNWCDIVGEEGDAVNCQGYTDSFLKRMNQRYPGTYRLPTEAEWEYAGRSATTTPYACGEPQTGVCPDNMAWFGFPASTPEFPTGSRVVATKLPNAWGLYDMHGNVWEWVHDWYGDYPSTPQINPTGPVNGEQRVIRGGGWFFASEYMKVAMRVSHAPNGSRFSDVGFRLVRMP